MNHDLHDHVGHPCRRWNFDIGLKPSKEILDTLKYVREHILAGRNGLGRLRECGCLGRRSNGIEKILTERRTPIPVKITPAGGYT